MPDQGQILTSLIDCGRGAVGQISGDILFQSLKICPLVQNTITKIFDRTIFKVQKLDFSAKTWISHSQFFGYFIKKSTMLPKGPELMDGLKNTKK